MNIYIYAYILILYCVSTFGMNTKVGCPSPYQVETFFSVSKTSKHLHKSIRSCVENECCFPGTINISNVNFTSQISIPTEPVFKNTGQEMYDPDSSHN